MNIVNEPRSIHFYRRIFYLFLAIYPWALFSEPLIGTPEKSYGITLGSADHGFSIGGYFESQINKKFQITFQGSFFDVAGEAESPVYNPYTNQYYNAGEKNLLLVPLFGGVKIYPFVDKIANNFNPLFMTGIGPIIILDTPEEGKFFERWKRVDTSISFGGFFCFGVEIYLSSATTFAATMGYTYFPMGKEVDGKRDYNGSILKLMFGWRLH